MCIIRLRLEDGSTNQNLLSNLKNKAAQAECVIIVAGLPASYESEGFDREHLHLPDGEIQMIKEASQVNKNVVVVLISGGVVECSWIKYAQSVLYMGLPGQAGAEAIVDLLYGYTNPSGHLGETWPLCYQDCISSSYYDHTQDALYKEGLYVGYRYYDKAHKNVRFPFGFGLSYSHFSYSDLQIHDKKVSCLVKNEGPYDGETVVQCYVSDLEAKRYRPLQELAGFKRVELRVNEEKRIEIPIDNQAFSIYNHGWHSIAGTYRISIGESSRHLYLSEEVEVLGDEASFLKEARPFYLTATGIPTNDDLASLLGHYYQADEHHKGTYTMDDTVEDMRKDSFVMKIMYLAVKRTIAKGFDGDLEHNPDFRMLMASSVGSPIRNMQISGGIKGSLFSGLLDLANGHYMKGLIKIIKGE